MSEPNLYNLSMDELQEQARILGIVVRGNVSIDTLRTKIKAAVEIQCLGNHLRLLQFLMMRSKPWLMQRLVKAKRYQPIHSG